MMTENEARKLGVSIEWNGRANVCVHCGKVPETFYVATGHDHTDYDIRWCPCREPNPNWCAGCSPDNCSGCVAESVESEPAVNECRLTLIHQIHELADHIERAAPSVTDSDMRKQMLGQREYALKVSAKWNMNGNPFSPQPDRTAELEQLRTRIAEKDEVIAEAGEMLAMRDRQLAALKAELEAEVGRLKSDHNAVCVIVADMHAAAVGKVTGPKLGVVEDVKELRHQLLAAIKPLEDEIADYTRIIRKKDEENEAANREIVRLEMELASVKEENDTLCRIHKENIDILVKELSDKDYEYNQKTNRLIERHAEQLNRCDAEVKRLTGRKDGEVPSY